MGRATQVNRRPWGLDLVRSRPLVSASILLALVALVVRLAYYALAKDHLTYSDSAIYMGLGEQLGKGAAYRLPILGAAGFPVDLLRPPGYPAFLMIAGGGSHISVHRVAIVQVVIGALSVGLLTYVVGRWTELRVAVLAGALLALDWVTILYTPVILSDFVFAVVYSAGLLAFGVFLHRKRLWWAIVAGLVLGLASLVKPAGEFGIAVIIVAILANPRSNWRGLVSLLAFALVAVPWAVRNDNQHGVFTLSTIPSVNAYDYTAEVAAHAPLLWTPSEAASISDQADRQLVRLHLTPSQLQSRMDRDAIKLIAHHLPKAIGQAGLGGFRTATGTGRDTLADSTADAHIPSVIGTLIPLAEIVLVWLLALVGTVAAWKTRIISRSQTVLLIAGVLLIILPSASPVANARFRLPAAPPLCVLAAFGGVAAIERLRRRSTRAPALAGS